MISTQQRREAWIAFATAALEGILSGRQLLIADACKEAQKAADIMLAAAFEREQGGFEAEP